MVPFRGNLILSRAVPVPRAKQAAPPGSQAPAPSNGQNRINNSMPVSNLNLILHPAPRQFRIPLPKQRKKGLGACPPPPRGLQKKKESPGFPLLQKVQTAPEFAKKMTEPWGSPGPQQNKTFKEQKRCAPLFRPGHSLKYRSKAIKTGKTQKNTACFSFFYIMHKITILPETKQGCNYRKGGMIPQATAGISQL